MDKTIFNLALTIYRADNATDTRKHPFIDADVNFLREYPDPMPENYLMQAQELAANYERLGIKYVTIHDDDYPTALRDLGTESPQVLYIKSKTPVKELFTEDALAVVGTRDPSPYGINTCRRIIGTLAESQQEKPVIVSGFALGIDITAHTAALEAGMKTIAVLPCGLDEVYPKVHTPVAERIATTPGCALISPFPPGTAPTAYNFLARNPIIAALAQTTIIVETKQKGGANIIARRAYELDRKVWAIPGRIGDIRSAGCNDLIKDGIADILTEKDLMTI